jgi:hypothetical protein
MNEFQSATPTSEFRGGDRADPVAAGDATKPAGSPKQVRRRELLHEAAIVTIGVLICIAAICVIVERTHSWSSDAAPTSHRSRGSI